MAGNQDYSYASKTAAAGSPISDSESVSTIVPPKLFRLEILEHDFTGLSKVMSITNLKMMIIRFSAWEGCKPLHPSSRILQRLSP
jgi:hypothetical protein